LNNQFYRYTGGSWLEVKGEDAAEFLQGQFTSNLQTKTANICTYGLWLDRKGKVQGDSFVMRLASGEYRIFSYETPAAALVQRLESYVITDDVEILDSTDSIEAISILGPDSEGVIGDLGALPDVGEHVATGDGVIFVGRRSMTRSYEIIVERSDIDRIVGRLRTLGLTEVEFMAVEAERIRSGIPAIPRELGPGDLPQEAGLEKDAVSFDKGCYLGQEVMARLHSMGRVRRRLVPVRVIGLASTPSLLFLGLDRVGELRTHIQGYEGHFNGVAMIRAELAGSQPVCMNFAGEVEARVLVGAEA
jgi:folate-binding protein YgfZ